MKKLTKKNILEFWQNATLEEQRENIDKALELTDDDILLEIWKETKKEIKSENPNLIIRIIRQKLSDGKKYRNGIWKNTPQEVQEKTIEEVMKIYKSGEMLKKLWRETHDSVKESKKELLAKVLNYDEESLKEYGIPECIPAPSNMFSKNVIDQIIYDLKQGSFRVVMQKDYMTDFENRYESDEPSFEEQSQEVDMAMKYIIAKIPSTSIPYFFKQISEGMPESYIKLFWNSVEKNVQYMVVVEVLRKISSEELRMTIWNEISSEMQKNKIRELLKIDKDTDANDLIKITSHQNNKGILEELIGENDEKVSSIWGKLPENLQLEYFESVMKMHIDEEELEYIWYQTSEQVQRNNFQQCLKAMNKDSRRIIELLKNTKFRNLEMVHYIEQEYHGKIPEEILGEFSINVPILKALEGKISSKISRELVIKNASELSIEKLEELLKSFNITTIRMVDDNFTIAHGDYQIYDVETYKKCRNAIDKLLDGIDLFQDLNNPNREKMIFGKVIKKLANHMRNDHATLQKENDKIATNEESAICRNLVGGLLNNACVCGGYAEIVRNVFACCGIETRIIAGHEIKGTSWHGWNQIKLDGVWYNMDLTWDRYEIVAEKLPRYLLKSDNDFKEHDEFDTSECKKEKCNITVPDEKLQKYLYGDKQIPKEVSHAIEKVRTGELDQVTDMIGASQQQALPIKQTEEMR